MNTIVSAIMSIIMALMSVIGGLFGFNSYKEYDAKMTREEVVALYNTSLTTAGTTGCTLNFYRTTTFDLNNIAVAGTLNEAAKKYFDINQNIDLAKEISTLRINLISPPTKSKSTELGQTTRMIIFTFLLYLILIL